MPIQLGDIKLVASAVMDDVVEGGGAPTSKVIRDNVSNEIFKDISESDRARGRLNMSKVFVSVQTGDTDTYLGANFIVARPPEDPNVSVTVFTTDEVYDTRAQAQTRMESYLTRGAEWHGFLYENHIAGQRTIQLFQRPGSELPTVGKTLVLVQNEGAGNQIEQYVRATRVSYVERTFTYDTDKDYKAWIVSVELSDSLRADMAGTSANRQFARSTVASKVRDTIVADAGNYAGVVPLKQPVAVGDFTIRAEGVYTPLVPSAQVETPITAQTPFGTLNIPVASRSAITYTTSASWSPTTQLTLPGPCAPNSLTIVAGNVTITDKGGLLVSGSSQVGTIDYANGVLTVNAGSYGGAKTITYKSVGYAAQMPQSYDVVVTSETRSLNYTGILAPLAAAGTLTVSYQVQSRWYVLSDEGDGTLRGYDQSYGVGTYNRETGDFLLTLGALPDVGSSIIFQWGVPTQTHSHPQQTMRIEHVIDLDPAVGKMVDPSYCRITWMYDQTLCVATVNSAGELEGDAEGKLDIAKGQLRFSPNAMPLPGTQINVEFDSGTKSEVTLAHPARNGQGMLPVNAGVTNISPGSLVVEWNTFTDLTSFGVYTAQQLREMGIGTSVDPTHWARDDGLGKLLLNDEEIGTVDYVTGNIVFNPDTVINVPTVRYSSQAASGSSALLPANGSAPSQLFRVNFEGIEYMPAATLYPIDESGYVKISCFSAVSPTRTTKTYTFAPELELVPGVSAQVVAGSVLLHTANNQVLADNGTGVLRERVGDNWTNRGNIDYVSGKIYFTSWNTNSTSTVTRVGTVTAVGEALDSAYVFRAAAAPLRAGSLTIQYGASGGGTLTVVAAADGTITGTGITGTVDYGTGVIRLGFGEFVTAAGNENEPWYHPSRVLEGGMIFKPQPVATSTLKYTAVAYSYLPLDADLIGVDPVRLPSDGRVPIFRTGSMVVIGNTQTTAPATVSNNQTVNLGRTRLSRAVVRDAEGVAQYSGYEVDLEAGTVTFGDVSEIEMPVTIEHRIEDMLVARDVQISGEMTFTRQVSHAYPVENTYVSSALEFGDRKARVSVTFDQASWDGVTWNDTNTSAVAPASYNTVLAPIEVTNKGASTERWALWFSTSTAFRVVGEHVGQIAVGDINTDCAPVNPATGEPYFTIRAIGWGTGWATGNVVRINTVGALCPVWVVRTTQPSIEAGQRYSFDLLTRGDVDRP